MKKSFFQRAFASAVAVPMALTQCLTYSSFAVDSSDSASTADYQAVASIASESLTIDSLLKIDAETDAVSIDENTYSQTSEWNSEKAAPLLLSAAGKTITVDLSNYKDTIVSNAGEFAEVTGKVLDQVSDVVATINSDNITFTAEIGDISGVIAEELQGRIDAALLEVKEDYPDADFSIIRNVDFSDLGDMSGEFVAVVDTSNVWDSTNFPVTYTITTGEGDVLTVDNLFDYIYDKFEVTKQDVLAAANEQIASVKAELDDAEQQAADAQAQFDEAETKLADAEAKLADAQTKLDDAKAKLDDAQAKLDEATALGGDTTAEQADLDEKKAEYDSKYSEYTEKKAEFDEKKAEFNEKKAEFAEKKAELAQAEEDFEAAGGEAITKINEVYDDYNNKLDKANDALESALNYTASKEFADSTAALSALKNTLASKNNKYAKKVASGLKTTVSALLSTVTGANAYNNIVSQLSQIAGNIDISAADFGAFADTLYDITFDAASGSYVISAKYQDAEQDAVKTYFETTKNLKVTDTWKEITLTATADSASSGSIQLDIVRIIKTEPITTTTTTTTTTSTTTTTTTSTTSDTTTTSADTTTTVDTTTTADTTTTVDTTTTADTTTTVDTTTTTTDVDTDTTTTTTTTTDVDADTTTTTTTTDPSVVNPGGTTTDPSVVNPGGTTTDPSVVNPGGTTTTTNAVTPGKNTTTTAVKVTSYSVKTVSAKPGYYFSHDNRGFDKGQIVKVEVTYTYSNGKTEVKDVTKDVDFGSATPASTWKRENTTFKYEVPLYLNGKALLNADGTAATVTAYIGVKGDANLDNTVDALDASLVLTYYANVQTSATLDKSITFSKDDANLDNLAALLSDADMNEFDESNWGRAKTDRTINALDASYILSYYALQQTSSKDKAAYENWNAVVPDRMLSADKVK